MKFIYPFDLVSTLKSRWEQAQAIFYSHKSSNKLHPPFPSDNNLKFILDTIYHASFLTEERRNISIRIAYIPPNICNERSIQNLHNEPFRFVNPKQFTVHEILCLAPSINSYNSIILICDSDKVRPEIKTSPIVIWGILHTGSEWVKNLRGQSSAAFCPPNILTLSTFAPGSLTVTVLGTVLARLESGSLLETPLEDISYGIIGDFFDEAAQELYSDSIKKLKVEKYNEKEDEDAYPYQIYFQTISNIIQSAKERKHGASFIFIPDEIKYDDSRLTDRINLKYILNIQKIWSLLIEECEANYHYFNLYFDSENNFRIYKDDVSSEDLKKLISWRETHILLEEEIHDFEKFVADLSGVDGAVLLTKKFKILGYGGEILSHSPSLKTFRMSKDPEAKKTVKFDIHKYGTRHRSAFRLCSSYEECVAFVISQDGGIKAIKRVGPNVIIWNNINIGRIDI